MTKKHEDRIKIDNKDYGYSIRVGTNVPANAVNLAYVHTPPTDPKKNLLITDMSSKITENNIVSTDSNTLVYPDDTFLLRELNKPFYSMSKNIIVTDEFSVPATGQETSVPLYYRAMAKGWFNARGATVISYLGGYIDKPITGALDYSQISEGQRDALLYLGGKIRITKTDGSPIPSQYKYKIRLEKVTGAGIPEDTYSIYIFTNFRGSNKESFMIRYEKANADGTVISDHTEVMNAYPFFSEITMSQIDYLSQNPKMGNGSWKPDLSNKNYALSETSDHKWQVYAPSQVLIADNLTRPAQQFSYKIRGRLRTKMDASNPGSINIGIIYLNDSIPNTEDLTATLKKTFEHAYKPQYLDFVNPHPPVGAAKESPAYWTVDLTMPSDYMNDYDLIIITGFGMVSMDIYNDALRTYLQNGGRLWIDNGGSPTEGTDVLELKNFLTNISFSRTVDPVGLKIYAISDANLSQHDEFSLQRRAAERLYNMNKNNMLIGYPNVNPQIEFGFGEDQSLWTNIVIYQSNSPSVMTRRIYDEGTLIVSNCGIFRSLANRNADDIKLVMNMILAIAEEKTVNTPWVKDYVYHRDNLFKEEYKNGDHAIYVDDRSDIDSTQIVAKKIINKSVRDALVPYMPSSYYRSKGTFKVEVQADSQVIITNSDFEVGTFDSTTGTATTLWTATTASAIPGWSVVYQSGINPSFRHVSSISERGEKAIQLTIPDGVSGGQSYWTATMPQLPIGTYRASVWIKTSNVQGGGAEISIHKSDGTLITTSTPILGTRDWTKVEVIFPITTVTAPDIRIGYVQADTRGTMFADFVEVANVGSVYMTPIGNGEQPLYAYSVRAGGDTIDLQEEGFTNADVTVYDPLISFYCMIRSFVYKWDNDLVKYVREYGNSSRTFVKIRRSDGMVNVGLLSTLVPDLIAGAEWADKDKIFFEITAEAADNGKENEFVNVGFFNMQTGRYFYSEAGDDVIGYAELYDPNSINNVVVQAWTDYYTIRATKRRYAVKVKGDERIYLEYPATIDDRDSWFVRVHNGNFAKNGLNYYEYEEFVSFYNGRQFGSHKYMLPEYDRQLFSPSKPYRRVRKEVCEYVNELAVKVQHTPLYVDGNNLEIFKRTYANGKIKMEELQSEDRKVFTAKNQNWMIYPNPVVYRIPEGVDDETNYVAPVDTYRIDYETGQVIFLDDVNDRIYVDYMHSIDKPVAIRDYDTQSGIIYLGSPISFKDELYCNYYYEEQYVEYRGYYDAERERFMHLDLNPTEGHYCTMPVVRTDLVGNQTIIRYDDVPTAKLMNKEVYIYLIPYVSSFNTTANQYVIRHCFSKAEWDKIRKTMPGIAVLLGVVQLREHAQVTNATVLDTRVRGGGIKESIPRSMMVSKDPLATNFWDIGPWEGQAYYTNGVLVIQLPKRILQSEGGQFTEKDVTDMLKKYIAYGVLPLVEYV